MTLPEDPTPHPFRGGDSPNLPAQVLILNDDPRCAQLFHEVLQSWTAVATFVTSQSNLPEILQHSHYDMFIIHHDSLRRYTIDLIPMARHFLPLIHIIVILSHPSESEVEAFAQQKVTHFIEPYLGAHGVRHLIETFTKAQQLALENLRLRDEVTQQTQELNQLAATASDLERTLAHRKREVELHQLTHVRNLMMPLVEELVQQSPSDRSNLHVQALQHYLDELTSGIPTDLESETPLSPQEQRVAWLVKQGMTSGQIADQLGLSIETVKTHRRNIRRKLGLTSSPQRLGPYLSLRSSGGNLTDTAP